MVNGEPLPNGIREDELVPLDALNERLGLGEWAMRSAVQEGLRTHRIGRRKFVLGRDLIAWLVNRADDGGDDVEV